MSMACDISIIITAHREKLLAATAVRSAVAAMAHAEEHQIQCEMIFVLDRADDLTRDTLAAANVPNARTIEVDLGDPGLARNMGLSEARAPYACFLDADDLWSENWLTEAHRFVAQRPDAILHPACNVFFNSSGLRKLRWHPDSESALCDPNYLEWGNYWTALAFAKTEILQSFPFRANDLSLGFGHEDWHWCKATLDAGIAHKPVPETIHFIRIRNGSQSDLVNATGGLTWPL
ncbi:MAG: glycosyltransferase family A protein [Pseudomonadota bacterium]